jgi:hypothetical protein
MTQWSPDLTTAPRGKTEDGWQPIETAPKGTHLLYFPAEKDRRGIFKFGEMMKVDLYPVSYPRKPTHWMPLPLPPITQSDAGAFAAGKAKGRLASADSAEPSASGLIVHKHIFLDDVGGEI